MDGGSWHCTGHLMQEKDVQKGKMVAWGGLTNSWEKKRKWKWRCCHVQLFVTPWTAVYQAPLSMGFSRQEYRSGLPLPSPTGPHSCQSEWISNLFSHFCSFAYELNPGTAHNWPSFDPRPTPYIWKERHARYLVIQGNEKKGKGREGGKCCSFYISPRV